MKWKDLFLSFFTCKTRKLQQKVLTFAELDRAQYQDVQEVHFFLEIKHAIMVKWYQPKNEEKMCDMERGRKVREWGAESPPPNNPCAAELARQTRTCWTNILANL